MSEEREFPEMVKLAVLLSPTSTPPLLPLRDLRARNYALGLSLEESQSAKDVVYNRVPSRL